MQKIVVSVFAVLTLMCSGLAQATPMKWNLSNVTLSDSTSATGSFFYDASTDTYSNWSISVAAGSLSAFTYNALNSQSVFSDATEFLVLTNSNSRYFDFDFAAPLTDAGGSILIETTPGGQLGQSSLECNDCKITRLVTGGSIIAATAGVPISVPEPATLLLTALALMGLAVFRRKA